MRSVKGKYAFSEHTADAQFTAYGKTLEQAFANAAEAFTAILVSPKTLRSARSQTITLSSSRPETLLFDFLDRLLYHLQTEHFLTKEVSKITIEEKTIKKQPTYTLNATINGEKLTGKHDISGDIKAITYHDMEIKKTKQGYALTAVVDL